MIIITIARLNSRFQRLFLVLHWECIFILRGEIYFSIQHSRKKRKGHRARFRENDDLPLILRGAAVIKKAPFFNARALVTREIMRSRDAQCNTGEWS